MLTIETISSRRDDLALTLEASESSLQDLKERTKVIKKEVANIRGALIELDRIIEHA